MTSMNGIVMALHPKQAAFVSSSALRRGYCGGRGSGKSFVCSYDLIKRAKNGRLYMVASPSYPMLKDATFRSFLHVGGNIMNRVIRHRSGGGNLWAKIATFDPDSMPSYGSAEVVFRTASDPDKLRGPNLSGVWLDEASVMRKEAFDIAIATLREGGEVGWIDLSFTPRGKAHWTYEAFYDKEKNGELRPFSEIFFSKMSDNPMLDDQFVQMMKTQYAAGSRLGRQELEGEFVDYDGLMFRREWFDIVQNVPHEGFRIRYWDKAATEGREDPDACFSVGTLVTMARDNTFYIEDVVRGQWSYGVRNKIIRQVAEIDAVKYNNTVTIWVEQEPGSGGKESALISISELAGFPVFMDRPQDNKSARAIALSSQAEVGKVKLKAAAWNEDWLNEIQYFPDGQLKDQTDSAAGAINKLALNGSLSSSVESLLVYPFPGKDQDGYIDSIKPQVYGKTETRSQATADLLNYLTGNRG